MDATHQPEASGRGPEQPPRVSAVLPVYNHGGYVGEAVASVLGQTFANLELIVVDDGSTDATPEVLARIGDPRVRLLRHDENRGHGAALQTGLEAARGELLAIQDADDVWLPDRLAAQVPLFDADPGLVVAGSFGRVIDEHGAVIGLKRKPTTDTGIRWTSLFASPFVHPSVVVRLEVVRRHGLAYDVRTRDRGADFQFLSKVLAYGRAVNLARPLVLRRVHPGQMTAVELGEHEFAALPASGVIRDNLRALGIDVDLAAAARLHELYHNREPVLAPGDVFLIGVLFRALDALRVRPGVDAAELRAIERSVIDFMLARGRRGSLAALRQAGLLRSAVRRDPLWVATSPARWLARRVRRAIRAAEPLRSPGLFAAS
jgi:glycosyltransferase involved in cell wall biosynthesis